MGFNCGYSYIGYVNGKPMEFVSLEEYEEYIKEISD